MGASSVIDKVGYGVFMALIALYSGALRTIKVQQ